MAGNIIAVTFIIISACCAVPLHNDCSIMSGWDDDRKELTKENVQYCIIDHCIIKRIDTGQELNIIDVGDDTLVTVAKDNTSTMIASLPNEEYCEEVDDDDDHMHSIEATVLLAMKSLLLVLVIILSSYIVVAYSLCDKLQSSVGKPFIFYNLLLSADKLLLLILMLFHTTIKATAPLCQTMIYIELYLKLSREVSISIIFTHIAYLLYQSRYYHFEMSVSSSNNLHKFYTVITFTIMVPMICFIALLDIFSGAGRDTVLSNGHCILPPERIHNTFIHLYGYSIPCKLAELIAFILVVVHYKSLYNPLKTTGAPSINGEPNITLLFSLVLSMGMSVFFSEFLWVFATILSHVYIIGLYVDLIANLIELLQQFIIAAKLTMMLKIEGLSKCKQFCV